MYSKFVRLLGLLLATCLILSARSSVFATYYSSTIIPSTYQNYGTPRDIFVLSNGDLWYADSENFRIVKINSSGQILRVVGREGADEGEFASRPVSITRDVDGFLYVLDSCKVYKLDSNGGYIKSWGSCGNGLGQLSSAYAIHYSAYHDALFVSDGDNQRVVKYDVFGNSLSSFGSSGTGLGQFNGPSGLTTDSNGKIYVVDTNNHRVQVFSADGDALSQFGSGDPGDSQFVFPKDVEILSDGYVYVTSQNARLIKKFDTSGNFISSWGVDGTGESEFRAPEYLGETSDGKLYVSDWDQKRIQQFAADGTFVKTFGNSWNVSGKFINPYSFDFDTSGNAYVLDSTGRVQKFDIYGNYVSTVVSAGVVGGASYHLAISPTTGNIFVSSESTVYVFDGSGNYLNTLGTHGVNGGDASGNGDFNDARGMAFDTSGNLYVADMFNNRIQKFDPTHISDPDFDSTYNGGYVSQWSSVTEIENIFIDELNNVYASSNEWKDPDGLIVQKSDTSGGSKTTYLNKYGTIEDSSDNYWKILNLFIDSSDNLYISDPNYNHIQIYNSLGNLVETVGSAGSDSDQFSGIRDVKVNPVSGDIYAIDSGNHRLQTFTSGVKIKNLISSADVLNSTNSSSLAKRSINPLSPNIDNISAEMYFGDYPISDFSVDLTANRDWSQVNAISLPDKSTTLVVNLDPVNAPGVSATHSLYVTKQPGQTYVVVCPNATTLADVSLTCTGGYTLNQGDPDLSVVTIGSQEYWKIDGLTGTGAISPYTKQFSSSSSSTSTTTSSPISITVTAQNDEGQTDSTYRGTVHFSSSPATSTLPADYTYTGGDAGVHTFNNITFQAAGTYTVTVTDTANSAVTKNITVTVTGSSGSSDSSNNSSSGSSSSSSSSGGSSVCSNPNPSSVRIFEARVQYGKVTLYYSPPAGSVSNYYISYGKSIWNLEHGVFTNQSRSGGVLTYTINHLAPGSTYYFRIRAHNDCAIGGYGNQIKLMIPKGKNAKLSKYYFPLEKAADTKKQVAVSKIKQINPVPALSAEAQPPEVSPTQFQPEPTIIPSKNLVSPIVTASQKSQSAQKKNFCILWWCF